ncbi:MAG: helix-turn-helix transcriptional regulator [Actinobacteria bacterium]|nr:helix-turn-helix transcriptional regulator [Actinomycetota bacterium]
MQIRGTWSAGPDDDQARFLADLRALRDSAAIGYDELAARAHYPSNVLKEAENGPRLPGLPILAAYVRACEGDVLYWEERWRKLNPDVEDDPDLPVRPAGASAAAVAGARAGTGVAPPDVYDPERIRAALRGDHARSEQARFTGGPDRARPNGASHIGTGHTGTGHTGTGHTATGHTATGHTGTAPASDFSWLRKSAPTPAEQAGAGHPPQRQTPEPADFRATPADRTDLQPPATPQWRAEDPAGTRASPFVPAQPAAGTGAASTAAASTAGTAGQAAESEADTRRPDRSFPVRLLMVIVIAALIGSALVMLLK